MVHLKVRIFFGGLISLETHFEAYLEVSQNRFCIWTCHEIGKCMIYLLFTAGKYLGVGVAPWPSLFLTLLFSKKKEQTC